MHAIRAAADAQLIQLAATWADAHPDPDPPTPATARRPPAVLGLSDPTGPDHPTPTTTRWSRP